MRDIAQVRYSFADETSRARLYYFTYSEYRRKIFAEIGRRCAEIGARAERELREARETFAEKDIVLVDTAGRSQRNAEKMEELKLFLEAGDFDQVHLVISSTVGESSLDEIMERFAPLATDHMILTKLDEGTCPGHTLRTVLKSGKSLSYLTTGQEVPDDIESAEAERFASIVLGDEI